MSFCPIPVELTFLFDSFLRVSFNYPVWSYGPVDPEELMRFKRRQVQPQQPRQSNTFRILQEGLERECFVSLYFLHSDLLNKALRMPHVIKTHMNCIGASLPSGAVQRSQRFRTCERCGYIIV